MFDLDSGAPNIFPAEYRQVALSTDTDGLDADALTRRFVGREAYMRTRFIVVRSGDDTALVEVARQPSDELFSPIEDLRVLAAPSECHYVHRPDIDVGVPSQVARVIEDHPAVRCLVIEGRYAHVSFVLNPAPLSVNVLDIVPPAPSKLRDQAQRVLDLAEDLPPILLTGEEVDSRDLLAAEGEAPTEHVLMPCRSSDVELGATPVAYLDQRPAQEDWTLLGCQRSRQIHEWFYGSIPPTVDTCPRRFLSPQRDAGGPTLTRCCLLQEGIESRGRSVLVAWGSSLGDVRTAIETLVDIEGFTWTPT
ncbi:MAG: hypothetical protein OEU32_20200 [Acidimicrobiia bacterium]|nr:hypothetical protein [Acidimicrobiia bacterium]